MSDHSSNSPVRTSGVSKSFALMSVIGILFFSGCGVPRDYPPLGRVTGTVTLDGQPVEGAKVAFFPDEGRSSAAMTDSQGKYDLFFANAVRGAAVGAHRVSINKIQQDPKYVPLPIEKAIYDPGPTMINLLPARYSGTKSELTATVNEGRNTIDFQLESKR